MHDQTTRRTGRDEKDAPARALVARAQVSGVLEPRQAKRLVMESEDRFLALVAATAQIVWTTPPDGLVEDMPLWREYTGQSVEEVRGWGWLTAVHPEDRDRIAPVWRHALATRGLYESEYRLRRADGIYRTFLVRAVPVLEADGSVREWVGVHTDITERTRLEEQQREATRVAAARAGELEAMFEALADGVTYYDVTGRIISMNASGRALLGRFTRGERPAAPDYVLAKTIAMRDERGRPLSEQQSPSSRLLRGETLSGSDALDILLRLPSGEEIQLSVTGAPVRDAEGQIIGAIAIYRDVTERRRLDRRTHDVLEALLAMAEALVRSPDEAVASGASDASGAAEEMDERTPERVPVVARELAELTRSVLGCERLSITGVNPETLTTQPLAVVGLSPELTRVWWENESNLPPLDERTEPGMLAAFRAGETLAFDLTQPSYAEAPNPYNIKTLLIAPMRIRDQLTGFVALDFGPVVHTFTPQEIALAAAVAKLCALVIERQRLLRERAEAQASALALQEANRRMDEFMSIASHELRTPLTSIKASVQLAGRRLTHAEGRQAAGGAGVDAAGLRTLLGRAERQTELLNRLVGDLLDVSRIQAGKLEMRPEPADLGTIVREAVIEQRQATPTRTLTLDVPALPIPILADADRIGQVVTNYLTNALKYSPEQTAVAVRVTREGETAHVSVRDAGPGIPAEERERVWERFHRVKGIVVQSGSGVGLGLGLHICKTIIERHSGTVGVESTVGEGATFWFTLPVAE